MRSVIKKDYTLDETVCMHDQNYCTDSLERSVDLQRH